MTATQDVAGPCRPSCYIEAQREHSNHRTHRAVAQDHGGSEVLTSRAGLWRWLGSGGVTRLGSAGKERGGGGGSDSLFTAACARRPLGGPMWRRCQRFTSALAAVSPAGGDSAAAAAAGTQPPHTSAVGFADTRLGNIRAIASYR